MRACIFCGEGPLTKEHAIPQWLLRVVNEVGDADDVLVVTNKLSGPDGEEGHRSHESKTGDVQVRAVCASCNSGWMAALEGRVKPLIEPLACGAETTLSIREQLEVATWAVKTVIVLEQHDLCQVSFFEEEARARFRRELAPPPEVQVRLAYRRIDGPSIFRLLHLASNAVPVGGRVDPEAEPNTFVLTLALGHLVIQVWGGPGMVNPTRMQTGGRFALTIFPPTPPQISWPPASATHLGSSEQQLIDFHESVFDKIANPEFLRPQTEQNVDLLE